MNKIISKNMNTIIRLMDVDRNSYYEEIEKITKDKKVISKLNSVYCVYADFKKIEEIEQEIEELFKKLYDINISEDDIFTSEKNLLDNPVIAVFLSVYVGERKKEYTSKEVALLKGLDASQYKNVNRAYHGGGIKGRKAGKMFLFPSNEVYKFINNKYIKTEKFKKRWEKKEE